MLDYFNLFNIKMQNIKWNLGNTKCLFKSVTFILTIKCLFFKLKDKKNPLLSKTKKVPSIFYKQNEINAAEMEM